MPSGQKEFDNKGGSREPTAENPKGRQDADPNAVDALVSSFLSELSILSGEYSPAEKPPPEPLETKPAPEALPPARPVVAQAPASQPQPSAPIAPSKPTAPPVVKRKPVPSPAAPVTASAPVIKPLERKEESVDRSRYGELDDIDRELLNTLDELERQKAKTPAATVPREAPVIEPVRFPKPEPEHVPEKPAVTRPFMARAEEALEFEDTEERAVLATRQPAQVLDRSEKAPPVVQPVWLDRRYQIAAGGVLVVTLLAFAAYNSMKSGSSPQPVNVAQAPTQPMAAPEAQPAPNPSAAKAPEVSRQQRGSEPVRQSPARVNPDDSAARRSRVPNGQQTATPATPVTPTPMPQTREVAPTPTPITAPPTPTENRATPPPQQAPPVTPPAVAASTPSPEPPPSAPAPAGRSAVAAPEPAAATAGAATNGAKPSAPEPSSASTSSVPVIPAQPIKKVMPDYPTLAKNMRVSGRVDLEVDVDASGNVLNATAVDGPMLLRGAAMEALKKWKFKPATRAGVNLPSKVRISVLFQ